MVYSRNVRCRKINSPVEYTHLIAGRNILQKLLGFSDSPVLVIIGLRSSRGDDNTTPGLFRVAQSFLAPKLVFPVTLKLFHLLCVSAGHLALPRKLVGF